MKNLAGFIYHYNSLCLKLFPAGKKSDIDWNCIVFSESNFDFYELKDSVAAKKSYIEYYANDEYNINPLRLKETIRYKCEISASVNPEKKEKSYLHFKNESNKLLKIERDDEKSLVFQFVNYLGKSDLYYDKDTEPLLSFEVVPDKINYETDYVNLTQAIAEECSALLLEYSSPTSLSFSQDSEKQQKTALEQFIFLRQFCYSDNIESLFASIKRNPDRILIEEDELKPFGQGLPSKRFFTNPFSYSQNWNHLDNDLFLPSEIAVTHKCESLDTPANRFLKFALNTFLGNCENIINYVEESSVYYSEASEIKNHIENILQDSFFDDVQDLTVMPVNNQVLEKREGYSQIFTAFSMVDLALQLDWKGKEEIYSGESKNTALLYEYWLFFELRKIIHELSGKDKNSSHIEPYNQFINDENGLTISLQQGKPSLQSFSFEQEGVTVNLYYNRTFAPAQFNTSVYWGSYSRPFRPDYTLAIFASKYKKELDAIKAGEVSYVHFDAKYRIQDLTQFIKTNRKVNSENFEEINEEKVTDKEQEEIIQEKNDEIINTYKRGDLLKMHTYNDAIRRTVGSYVLYPGCDTNSGSTPSVYDEILPGVGAFAIRPGNEKAGHETVKIFIRQIITFKAKGSSRQFRKDYFENMIINSPTDEKSEPIEDSSNEYQMIGFIRNEYLNFLTSNHLVPVSEADFRSNPYQEIYFYFYAIKDGKVYTIHKETNKAKYLRLTNTDINDCREEHGFKFQYLLPWEAEIKSMELVSKDTLKERLDELYAENPFKPKNGFHADFYYLVKAVIKYSMFDSGIIAVNTTENDAISVYSPKIVERIDG